MSRFRLSPVADLDDLDTFAPIGRAQVAQVGPAGRGSSRPDGDRTRAARDLAVARRAARRARRISA